MADFRGVKPGLLAAVLAAAILTPLSRAEAVSICVLGNEAVRISSETSRVLIDGIYREGFPEDVILSAALRERIETAEAEFSNLDLVLITHSHIDHFDADAVARHFKSNPAARLISTTEVVAALNELVSAYRMEAVEPSLTPVQRDFGGIRVTVFNLHHGEANSTQNLGFLFEIDGVSIFHLGDTMADREDLKAAGLNKLKVDIALVPFWYYLSEERAKQLDGILKAGLIVPIHLPKPDADKDYIKRFGGFAGLQEAIEKIRPNTILFEGGAGCLADVK
ncbi:MAG: MBL fold metallo-hydrolase [Sphingomonadales bacterium]